jgi:hypothetical protein
VSEDWVMVAAVFELGVLLTRLAGQTKNEKEYTAIVRHNYSLLAVWGSHAPSDMSRTKEV